MGQGLLQKLLPFALATSIALPVGCGKYSESTELLPHIVPSKGLAFIQYAGLTDMTPFPGERTQNSRGPSNEDFRDYTSFGWHTKTRFPVSLDCRASPENIAVFSPQFLDNEFPELFFVPKLSLNSEGNLEVDLSFFAEDMFLNSSGDIEVLYGSETQLRSRFYMFNKGESLEEIKKAEKEKGLDKEVHLAGWAKLYRIPLHRKEKGNYDLNKGVGFSDGEGIVVNKDIIDEIRKDGYAVYGANIRWIVKKPDYPLFLVKTSKGEVAMRVDDRGNNPYAATAQAVIDRAASETRDGLGRIRTAISIYYGENEGSNPARLEDLVPKYLHGIPPGNWDYSNGEVKSKSHPEW